MRMDENGVNVVAQKAEDTRTAYQVQYTIDAITPIFAAKTAIFQQYVSSGKLGQANAGLSQKNPKSRPHIFIYNKNCSVRGEQAR